MTEYNFDRELACKIGVDEAIVIHNLIFWIEKNMANRKHFYDGRYWTYNSVRAFTDLFPFWTAKELRRIMESLYSQGVVIKGNYNQAKFDKTGWYSIADTYNYLLPKWANDVLETSNGVAQKGKPIPYNKTYSNTLPNGKDGTLPFSDNELKAKRKRFISPTLAEVNLIIKDKKLAQKFINHYTANGWIVGKTKMVDWQAAANNWIININEEVAKNSNQQSATITF